MEPWLIWSSSALQVPLRMLEACFLFCLCFFLSRMLDRLFLRAWRSPSVAPTHTPTHPSTSGEGTATRQSVWFLASFCRSQLYAQWKRDPSNLELEGTDHAAKMPLSKNSKRLSRSWYSNSSWPYAAKKVLSQTSYLKPGCTLHISLWTLPGKKLGAPVERLE